MVLYVLTLLDDMRLGKYLIKKSDSLYRILVQ